MRNKLVDLNDHLFAEIERLSDEDLTEDKLKFEQSRAKAMADISKNIIENAKVSLQAAQFQADYGVNKQDIPEILEYGKKAKTPNGRAD